MILYKDFGTFLGEETNLELNFTIIFFLLEISAPVYEEDPFFAIIILTFFNRPNLTRSK